MMVGLYVYIYNSINGIVNLNAKCINENKLLHKKFEFYTLLEGKTFYFILFYIYIYI